MEEKVECPWNFKTLYLEFGLGIMTVLKLIKFISYVYTKMEYTGIPLKRSDNLRKKMNG